MGVGVSSVGCPVKLLRRNRALPAVVDAHHASTLFSISQRLPGRATLVLDSSTHHVFCASGAGPTPANAHQKAIDEIVERHAGSCDVLLTSHTVLNPNQLVLTCTPITVATSNDQTLAQLPTLKPGNTRPKP